MCVCNLCMLYITSSLHEVLAIELKGGGGGGGSTVCSLLLQLVMTALPYSHYLLKSTRASNPEHVSSLTCTCIHMLVCSYAHEY